MDNLDWVIIGRFGRAHGLKGFVTIISFTDPRENILQYTPWHARINEQWQPIELIQVEVNNKFILAQVKGYAEREQVTWLTNIDIAITRDRLPKLNPGEYYWYQLLHMQVINQQGIVLGAVTEVMPTGSNDVLVVVGEKRHLIPYLHDVFIQHIDNEKRLITVDWDMDFS